MKHKKYTHHSITWVKLAIFTLLLVIEAYFCQAQTIKHHSYTTYYNAKTGEPDSVKWTLTPAMLDCQTHLERSDKFTADSLIPNTKFNKYYEGSGYDQGHQFPAQDASCSTVDERECFFFSNMVPQLPKLNRITWKALEAYTRKLAATQTVYVTCGVIPSDSTLTGKEKTKKGIIKHHSNINIPTKCWKRLVYGDRVEYYVMPNCDTVVRHGFGFYRVNN